MKLKSSFPQLPVYHDLSSGPIQFIVQIIDKPMQLGLLYTLSEIHFTRDETTKLK